MKRIILSITITLVGLTIGGNASAQEFRVTGLGMASSQSMLDGSAGFGVLAGIGLTGWLDLVAGVALAEGESQRVGTACGVFRPYPVDCAIDLLEEHVSIRTYRAGARASAQRFRPVHLGATIGFSLSELRSSSMGMDTGLPGTLYSPTTANFGGFMELAVTWTPVADFPLGLVMAGTGSWIAFEGCRVNELDYAPFCGSEGIMELQIGLSFRPSR
jgi:hypothetical protein